MLIGDQLPDHDTGEPVFLQSVTVAKPDPETPPGLLPWKRLGVLAVPEVGFYASNAWGEVDYKFERRQIDVEFSPLPTLSIEVELKDGGSGRCAGYCSASPARKYYHA